MGRQIIRVINQSLNFCKTSKSNLKSSNYFVVSRNASTSLPMDTDLSKPPIALQKPHKVIFGAVEGENRGEYPFKDQRYRNDHWFWLRDDSRKNKEVLDHLTTENLYTEQKTKPLNPL